MSKRIINFESILEYVFLKTHYQIFNIIFFMYKLLCNPIPMTSQMLCNTNWSALALESIDTFVLIKNK